MSLVSQHQLTPMQVSPLLDMGQTAEETYLPHRIPCQSPRPLVVVSQNQHILRALIIHDVTFGSDIGLHSMMAVQMIRCDVQQARHRRAHIHQLKLETG